MTQSQTIATEPRSITSPEEVEEGHIAGSSFAREMAPLNVSSPLVNESISQKQKEIETLNRESGVGDGVWSNEKENSVSRVTKDSEEQQQTSDEVETNVDPRWNSSFMMEENAVLEGQGIARKEVDMHDEEKKENDPNSMLAEVDSVASDETPTAGSCSRGEISRMSTMKVANLTSAVNAMKNEDHMRIGDEQQLHSDGEEGKTVTFVPNDNLMGDTRSLENSTNQDATNRDNKESDPHARGFTRLSSKSALRRQSTEDPNRTPSSNTSNNSDNSATPEDHKNHIPGIPLVPGVAAVAEAVTNVTTATTAGIERGVNATTAGIERGVTATTTGIERSVGIVARNLTPAGKITRRQQTHDGTYNRDDKSTESASNLSGSKNSHENQNSKAVGKLGLGTLKFMGRVVSGGHDSSSGTVQGDVKVKHKSCPYCGFKGKFKTSCPQCGYNGKKILKWAQGGQKKAASEVEGTAKAVAAASAAPPTAMRRAVTTEPNLERGARMKKQVDPCSASCPHLGKMVQGEASIERAGRPGGFSSLLEPSPPVIREEAQKAARIRWNLAKTNVQAGDLQRAKDNFNLSLQAMASLEGNCDGENCQKNCCWPTEDEPQVKPQLQQLQIPAPLHQQKAEQQMPCDDSAYCHEMLASIGLRLSEYDLVHLHCDAALERIRQNPGKLYMVLPRILIQKGEAFVAQGMLSDALQCYSEAVSVANLTPVGDNQLHLGTSLTKMGELRLRLGESEQALENFRDALVIRRTTPGDLSKEIVNLLRQIGSLQCSLGHYDEAISSFGDALAILQRTPDLQKQQSEEIKHICDGLCAAYAEQGYNDDVVDVRQKQVSVTRRVMGKYHEDVASVLHKLALAYFKIEQPTKAAEAFDHELKIRMKNQKTLPEEMCAQLFTMGNFLLNHQDHDRALAYYEEAIILSVPDDEEEEKVPSDIPVVGVVTVPNEPQGQNEVADEEENWISSRFHKFVEKFWVEQKSASSPWPITLLELARVANNMGNLYSMKGSFVEAVSCYEVSLRIVGGTDENGDSCPLEAVSVSMDPLEVEKIKCNKGAALLRMGSHEKALETFDGCLSFLRLVAGDDYAKLSSLLNHMGNCHYSKGTYEQAIQCYKESIRMKKEYVAKDPIDVMDITWNVGMCLWKTRKYGEALAVFEEILRIRIHAHGSSTESVASTLHMLGTLHGRRRRYEKATSCFEQCLRIRKRVLGDLHEKVADTLHNLGLSRLGLGEYNSAMAILEGAHQAKCALFGCVHPEVGRTCLAMARVHLATNEVEMAQEQYDRAMELVDDVSLTPLGPSHPIMREAQEVCRMINEENEKRASDDESGTVTNSDHGQA